MKWNKKGLIFSADGRYDWMEQFAMLPTPLLINDKCLRIFIGFCDKNNVGRIGYVDVNPSNPSEIISISEKPVLDIGEPGCFDDNGVVPVSIIRKDDKVYLYYIGFQLGVKIPYYMFCGLAISNDNGETFKKYSKCPILDRNNEQIFARCGVNVINEDEPWGVAYKMWYIGTIGKGWVKNKYTNKEKPLYTMFSALSDDGIHWLDNPYKCMEFLNEDEHGFGRPFVWKENSLYKMLYSIRTYSRGYYIGYAESEDGIKWIRKDNEAGITLSKEGWDNENISYPYITKFKDKTYLFYNGNGCGKTGFGYAELEKQ